MTVVGTLSTGEAVEVLSFDGALLEVLVSGRAFAPGAPAAMTLGPSGEPLSIALKCHGSKRQEDGRFLVRGRAISLTREHRDRLLAVLASVEPR